MRTFRKTAGTALCAAALTTGTIALAGPASAAGTGEALYNCSDGLGGNYSNVDIFFNRTTGGFLTVGTGLTMTPGPSGTTAMLSWGGTPPDIPGLTEDPLHPGQFSKSGTPSLPTPPRTIISHIPTTPPVTVTCVYTATVRWPVGGI
ncbi:hypothetical protein ACPA54_23865 [Uniformispora flossi]|uniref:hypothetical protein n=1 Tax=Uniformispora flossi TaxID=3390723 RepID=UPI003C2F57D3